MFLVINTFIDDVRKHKSRARDEFEETSIKTFETLEKAKEYVKLNHCIDLDIGDRYVHYSCYEVDILEIVELRL